MEQTTAETRAGRRPGGEGAPSSPPASAATATGEEIGPLASEIGSTRIAEGVVQKVAGLATREVPGVHDLGGGAARAFGGAQRALGMGDERAQGVSVEVGEREAAVDLVVVVEYGESIPQVAQQVRDNVIKRIEGITGLHVTEVNIAVNDLYFPGDEQPQESGEGQPRAA